MINDLAREASDMTVTGFDAAYPTPRGPSPAQDRIVAYYAGGDTPHVATLDEWNAAPQTLRLPIYVCDNPTSRNPQSDAADFIAQLRRIGCPPTGRLTLLDYETAVDGAYLLAFDRLLVAAGYRVMVYGSRSTVFKNPKPSGGYMAADWTSVPHMVPGSDATQYEAEPDWDDDEFVATLPFWNTAHTATAAQLQQEDHMQIESKTEKPSGEYSFLLGGLTGQVSSVVFGYDGYSVTTAKLRVVTWDAQGRKVSEPVSIGPGGAPDNGGPAQHRTTLKFDDPATTYMVTVTREDANPYPVGVAFQ